MHHDLLKTLGVVIRDLGTCLRYHQDAGLEYLSPAEAKEIGIILDRVTHNLSGQVRPCAATSTLEDIRHTLGDCRRCKLSRGRISIVFGTGSPEADLVLVGEAPGREEDEAGEPFVGEAGQLLTRILHAIGLRREDVYITNVVKCRPPKNRDPEAEEICACVPVLKQQLEIIQPKVICALGRFAAQTLLETNQLISRLRGTVFQYGRSKLVPTYHPASLLRNPQWKRDVWHDIQVVQKLLAVETGSGGQGA